MEEQQEQQQQPAAAPGMPEPQPAKGKKASRRRWPMLIPIVLIVAAAAIGGWYWYLSMRAYVSTDDAFVDANRVAASAKILGRIDTLFTDEGDTVRQGEVVAVLDRDDILAREHEARASLELARQSVPLSDVNIARAQDDFDRAQVQFKQGVIPKDKFDHAQRALEAAKAERAIALSKIQAAQAQLGVVQTQLDNSTIYAPLTGVVAKRWVLPGDVVQPGQPIFTVYDLEHEWVTANLEEPKMTNVREGQHVDISIDTYPDLKLSGTIYQIGTYTASQFSLIPPNNASGNFTKVSQRIPIKISIDRDPPGQPLYPGMSAEISIKVK